jgi:NAD(P)-dependent dehydrogenase (short-subunit alcohol dehydrogenase family)
MQESLGSAKQLLQKQLKLLVALMYSCAQRVKVSHYACNVCGPLADGNRHVAVIGAVEELAQSSRTISLVDEIFEINFFANVNIIKAILPVMRQRKNGHVIVITGISKSSLDTQKVDADRS